MLAQRWVGVGEGRESVEEEGKERMGGGREISFIVIIASRAE